MKFAKGILLGGVISAGLIMMYMETDGMNRKKAMKKGRQIAKKMGIM